jgi:hypothetical protein
VKPKDPQDKPAGLSNLNQPANVTVNSSQFAKTLEWFIVALI